MVLSIELSVRNIAIAAIILVLAWEVVQYIQYRLILTEPTTWQQALVTMGLPSSTKIPESSEEMAAQIYRGICLKVTEKKSERCSFTSLNEQVSKMSEFLRYNNIGEFQTIWAQTIDDYSKFRVERTNNIVQVGFWVILLYVTVNIVNQILAIFVSWPLPGPFKSKITAGGAIVVLVALFTWVVWVQNEAKPAAFEAFSWGLMMGMITLLSSLTGVIITLKGREIQPANPRIAIGVKVLFGVISAIVGSGTDTVFQTFIVTDIIITNAGKITMQECIVMYLLGALFFRLVSSVFGPYITVAQASTVEEN